MTPDKEHPVKKAAVLEPDFKADKSKILNRLRRLEGQVRGLHKMVEEERPCRDILTLLAGVRSALDAAGDQILEACFPISPAWAQPPSLNISASRTFSRLWTDLPCLMVIPL